MKGEISLKDALARCRQTAHRPVRHERSHRFVVDNGLNENHLLCLLYSCAKMEYPGATRELRLATFQGDKTNPISDYVVGEL